LCKEQGFQWLLASDGKAQANYNFRRSGSQLAEPAAISLAPGTELIGAF
jgi:hypothetical protein